MFFKKKYLFKGNRYVYKKRCKKKKKSFYRILKMMKNIDDINSEARYNKK